MALTNVLIAGVGGQGVILASELLALAALADGRDVKQGEFHGVAQRGGAVFSHVRFGDRVHSPMARRAHVDYLVALEELEALRYAHFVKPGGTILVNRLRIEPARIGDERSYPPNAIEFLSARNFRAIGIEANAKASELGNYRTANVILLGALAVHLDIPGEVWRQTLADRIPAKLLDLNLRAFTAGQALVA